MYLEVRQDLSSVHTLYCLPVYEERSVFCLSGPSSMTKEVIVDCRCSGRACCLSTTLSSVGTSSLIIIRYERHHCGIIRKLHDCVRVNMARLSTQPFI